MKYTRIWIKKEDFLPLGELITEWVSQGEVEGYGNLQAVDILTADLSSLEPIGISYTEGGN